MSNKRYRLEFCGDPYDELERRVLPGVGSTERLNEQNEEIAHLRERVAELERELAEARAELQKLAPFLAAHGVDGYSFDDSTPTPTEDGDGK